MKSRASRKSLGTEAPANNPLSGAELARLWAEADLFSPAFGGCMCAGGFHSPVDANTVAQDLLIFLEDKYRNSGRKELAEFLAKSQERAQDFDDWLIRLDQETLETSARALLLDDLQKTLSTMTKARGFTCT